MRARLRTDDPVRAAALAALAVLALSVPLAKWFQLADYEPDGWDATWWARVALLAALLAIVALRLRRDRDAAALALIALACVAVRVIWPPDFGFAFDGLDVPVDRSWGVWLALAVAAVALALAAWLARRTPAREPA